MVTDFLKIIIAYYFLKIIIVYYYNNKRLYYCCGLQIRPVEEQLKQRVIGKRYCISRKRKS